MQTPDTAAKKPLSPSRQVEKKQMLAPDGTIITTVTTKTSRPKYLSANNNGDYFVATFFLFMFSMQLVEWDISRVICGEMRGGIGHLNIWRRGTGMRGTGGKENWVGFFEDFSAQFLSTKT